MLKTTATTAVNAMPQEPGAYSFLKIVGSSAYRVNVFTDGVSKESAEEKLLRCVKNDARFNENVLQKGGSSSQRTVGQDVPPYENRCAILRTRSESQDQSAGGSL